MTKTHLKFAGLAASFACASLFPVLGESPAMAQMTQQTCMNMGGGMTSCRGMVMGGGTSQPDYEGQRVLGETVGRLLFGDPEKRFRKRIGSMLADGKCREAAEFAYREGRLEIGSQIAQNCQRQSTSATAQPSEQSLPEVLQNMAANASVPYQFDEITTVTKVSAIGSQLLFHTDIDTDQTSITDAQKSGVANLICAEELAPELIAAGGSIRVLFSNSQGGDMGAVLINRSVCGL